MMSDMKLCPFCGEDEQEALTIVLECAQPIIRSQVECLNCGARGPVHYNGECIKSAKEGAVYVWDNERI